MTTSLTWTETTGTSDMPFKEVQGTFNNACEALKALNARSAQIAFNEQLQNDVARLKAECEYWRAKQAAATQPAPSAPEPAPTEEPPAEPVEDPTAHPAEPPGQPQPTAPADDTPQAQGAPAPPAKEKVAVDSEPGPSSYSALAPQLFGPPPYNMPPEWIQQLADAPTTGGATDEDWLLQMLRGRPEPGKRSWSHSDPPARQPARKGDPVDLFTGQFTIDTTDLDVPTPFLPLRLRRCYRSGLPYFGPWGFNWDHNYNQFLRELSDGSVAVWIGQLYEIHFRVGEAGWEPEPGIHQRLSSSDPGVYGLTLRQGVRLRFERPSTWHDPQRIPLVEIADRHGNRQLIDYDGLDRVLRVAEHPHGASGPPARWLEFEYGNCGLLEGLHDHAGRQVRYDHHPEIEHLVQVVLPEIEGYPKGVCTEYRYDEEADHPAVRHNIVGVIDADDQLYLENVYAGPEELWAFNRVVRQRVGDDVFEFGYEQLQYVPRHTEYANVPAVQTTHRPPDGALHTYTFNYRGDRLDHRYRLNRDGSGRVVIWRWEHDNEGNVVTQVDPAGRATAMTYDHDSADPCARENLRTVTLLPALAYLDNPRTVLQVDYDPVFQLPTRIVDALGAQTTFDYVSEGRLGAVHPPAVVAPGGETQAGKVTMGLNEQGLLEFVETALGVRHEITRWGTPWAGLPKEIRLDRHEADLRTSFEYNPIGFPGRITDTFGGQTTMTCNDFGQLEEVELSAVDGQAARHRFRYAPDGTLVRLETPRGEYTDSVVTGSDLVSEFHLDALGRPAEDVVGVNTAGPRHLYRKHDYAGNLVELVAADGCVVTRSHDERGLVLDLTVGGLTLHFTYEIDGALRRIRYPDGSTRTAEQRDAWGRATRVREPNGTLHILTWGSNDRLEESVTMGDPGDGSTRMLARCRYEFDARGRLMREHRTVFDEDPATAAELTTTYHYDADDRLRRVVTPTAETSWDYDGVPRIKRHVDPVGNTTRITRHQGIRAIDVSLDEVEPAGTRTTTWRFTADERMRPRRIDLPGGATVELIRDDRDLVVERREPLNVVRRFRYGLLGELEEVVVDPAGLAIIARYQHDDVGRLLSFTDPGGAVTTWERDFLGAPR